MVSCKTQFLLVFVYLWLWWTTCSHVISAKHSLKPGEKLNSKTNICSENGIYCISFSSSTGDCYLQIVRKRGDSWSVWFANRNEPVDAESAVLLLDHSGVLKIESKHRELPIILYFSPQPANNTMATLLDTGNFVLQQLHPNGTKSVLWQSFDYPTDNLLPGMKLGVSYKTSHNWSLVSWLTSEIPNLGAFSLEWQPRTRELIIKRREQLCWTSGELRNKEGFMHNTHYRIVSNENESYFTITTSNEELTRWVLLETGQLINRNGGDDVARADMCYGYNTDGGCQKWDEIPICRHRGDAFEDRLGYPSTNMESYLANSSYGPSDCQDICWKNCSCIAYSDYDGNNETGCTFYHWNSTKGTNLASGGMKFRLLVKNTDRKEERRKGMKTNKMTDLATANRFYDVKDLEDEFKKRQDLKVLNYTSVLSATDDFSTENKLGQGGFGPVYKGILPTGQEVAIKRLSKTSTQGIVEFKNELMLISELQHTNLVQLLGFCIHEEERILIYEYMPNKSLDFYLFDCTRSMLLDWKKRFNIIEGISQGILYLHKYSRLKIIHRDLKASNILLDENMNPKISDFGLARMFMQQESTGTTSRIVGTYGYMSPEYAMEGTFSTKSDVYSFGVLLLEIVSGRKNTSFYDVDHLLNLIGHAWELWNQGESLQLLDPSLNDSFDPDEVKRCIHVGLLCVEHYANDRPTMSNVISMLTNESAPVTLPRRPAFYVERKNFDGKTSSKELCVDSTDEFTASTY
uniref:Receptor-like serine/threonine-protein kinase n=1 Tax=Glycine max TaxID=3847 RepID=A0A0R0G425_SOYBN